MTQSLLSPQCDQGQGRSAVRMVTGIVYKLVVDRLEKTVTQMYTMCGGQRENNKKIQVNIE